MEAPHIFGEFENLVGVAHPSTSQQQSDVAVIMLTAGMSHHVGPYGLYVAMARQLAAHGLFSFRFDLSGIGESLAVGAGGTSLQRATSETQQAMDFVSERYGIERFVLLGLCSGADDSIHTALADERVAGAVLLDGCGYRTAKYYVYRPFKHYLPRLFSCRKWKSILRRRASKNAGNTTPESLRLADDIREFPERDQAAREIQTLADRGVRLRFVYSGGVHYYYNYKRQFDDMFHDVRFRGNVSSMFYPKMDHVAILSEDRAQLVQDTTAWLSENFPAKQANQVNPVADESVAIVSPTFDLSANNPLSATT